MTASPTYLKWPGWPEEWVYTVLQEVFEWVLAESSRNLTHVQIDFQVISSSSSYYFTRPWSSLQVLHFQDGTVDITNLTNFLSATAATLTRLHLDSMYLVYPDVPGPYSWASALDHLRAYCRANGGRPTIRVRQPRGAEFHDHLLPESDAAYLRSLFDPDDDDDLGLSAVDRYIEDLSGDRNPIVEAGRTPLLYP